MVVEPALSGFELIVHIGNGKTGTSSIQKTFADQTAPLKRQGVAYLGLMLEDAPPAAKVYPWMIMRGWAEFKSLEPEVAGQQLKDALLTTLKQLKSDGFKAAIWSNESLFGDGSFIGSVLKNIYEMGAKVKVIAYVRRHDTWARSAYLQWGIKHKTYRGPVKSFREWYELNDVNFSKALKLWLEHDWLELHVRNFDACQDVVVDFLSVCNLDPSEITVRRHNETPNSVALALWSLYNSQFDEPVLPVELQKLIHKGGVLDRAPIGSDFNSLLPTVDDIDQVFERSAEDRAFVNELFAQNDQPKMPTDTPKKKNLEISQEQLNAALLLLVKHQSDRIDILARQVRQLRTKVSDKDS